MKHSLQSLRFFDLTINRTFDRSFDQTFDRDPPSSLESVHRDAARVRIRDAKTQPSAGPVGTASVFLYERTCARAKKKYLRQRSQPLV